MSIDHRWGKGGEAHGLSESRSFLAEERGERPTRSEPGERGRVGPKSTATREQRGIDAQPRSRRAGGWKRRSMRAETAPLLPDPLAVSPATSSTPSG